jgi:hypothetical protein
LIFLGFYYELLKCIRPISPTSEFPEFFFFYYEISAGPRSWDLSRRKAFLKRKYLYNIGKNLIFITFTKNTRRRSADLLFHPKGTIFLKVYSEDFEKIGVLKVKGPI